MGATCGHKVLDGHDRDALHELWRPLGSHFLWRGFHIYERAALSQWSCCEACEVCSPSWADREEGCEGQGLPKCIPWRWLHHDVAQKKDFFFGSQQSSVSKCHFDSMYCTGFLLAGTANAAASCIGSMIPAACSQMV